MGGQYLSPSAPPVGRHTISPFLMTSITKGQRAQIWAKDPPSPKAGCDLILVISLQHPVSRDLPLQLTSSQPFCSSSRGALHAATHSLLFPAPLIPRLQNSQINSTPACVADWGHSCRAENQAPIHAAGMGTTTSSDSYFCIPCMSMGDM